MANQPTEYKDLARAIMSRAANERVPANGTFEITARCNLTCNMCYIAKPAGDRVEKARELTAEQWVFLAREAVQRGMLFLLLTGGEVFLRPDFFEIYEPMTEMGLSINVFTNATLVTAKIAERLRAAPPNRLEVTIYGASDETFRAVTGRPGGFDRCRAGIEHLLSVGTNLTLKTTLTRQNHHELDAMRKMAEDWGVGFQAGWLLSNRRDRCGESIENVRFTAHDAVRIEALDARADKKWKTIALKPKREEPRTAFYCSAGKSTFVIGPTGDMNICVDTPLPRARPLEVGFDAAWQQLDDFIRSVPDENECSDCQLQDLCTRCPAWALVETGNINAKVPYLCEVAAERQKLHSPSEALCAG